MALPSTDPRISRRLRVLIADDQPHMRRLLRRALESSDEFEVTGEASDGREALSMTRELKPDIVLVDLVMPVMDGVQMIRGLRKNGLATRVVVLTAHGDRDAVAAALEAGADGYILKGCPADKLRAAILDVSAGGTVLGPAVARGVVDDYTRMLEEKRERDFAVIRTLATAVEARDEGTGNHANNVAELSLTLWHAMGHNGEEDLVYGFLLHDVGKIGVPDAILLKPAPLTDDEWTVMRRHVDLGVDMVRPLGFRPVVLDLIQCHHERWDGRGYPAGLAGQQIPLHARIFSVVDAFDAMTSDRPYRKALPAADALEELERNAGTQFDPHCVRSFVQLSHDLGFV